MLGYSAHAYHRDDDLAGVIICDREYPPRVAYSLLSKLLEEFNTKFPISKRQPPITFPLTTEYLQKYQDPTKADSIMRLQQELDDTKIILVVNEL